MAISQDRFERIVKAMPSLTDGEKATVIALGVEVFVAHGKAVDDNEGPASAIVPPGGLRPSTAMTLTNIAEGKSGPWDSIL